MKRRGPLWWLLLLCLLATAGWSQSWLDGVPSLYIHHSTTTERNSPYWCQSAVTHDSSEQYHCSPVVFSISIVVRRGHNYYDCIATPSCASSAFCRLPVAARYDSLVAHAKSCGSYDRVLVGAHISGLGAFDSTVLCLFPKPALTFQELDATCTVPGCRLWTEKYKGTGEGCGDSLTILRLNDPETRDTVAWLIVQNMKNFGDFIALDNIIHPSSTSKWYPFLPDTAQVKMKRKRDSVWNTVFVPYLRRIGELARREGRGFVPNISASLAAWDDVDAPIPWDAVDGICCELPLANAHDPAHHQFASPALLKRALRNLRSVLERGKVVFLYNHSEPKSHYGGPGPTHIGGDAAPALDSLRRKQELIAATILLVKDPQQYAFVNIPHPNWWPYWNERWEPNDPNSPTVADSVLRFVRWPLQLGEPIEGPDTIGITEWQHKRCFEYGTLWVDFEFDSVQLLRHIPQCRVQIFGDSVALWNVSDTDPRDTVTHIFVDFGDGTTTGWIRMPALEPLTHRYSTAGTYTITFLTRDPFDCMRSTTQQVTIKLSSVTPRQSSPLQPLGVRMDPQQHLLHIELNSGRAPGGLLRVYNFAGQLVESVPVQMENGRKRVELDVSSWARGMYFVLFLSSDGAQYGTTVVW
ncbi:MAG: hypothetical protein KatS3mg039_1688 [Candidatus Kapaibacterium sp.]|nr:MAG: hypothetical protein KatS3mg039_1688 [Candidatus Kapabacteria bacterium]